MPPLGEAKKVARPGLLEVQTGNFSLYPRYAPATSSGRATINGWQGSAELIVEGRDMAAIGQLTGRITTMTIANVAYRLSREASQRVEAEIVAEAIAAFRAKAASYSRLFGYGGLRRARGRRWRRASRRVSRSRGRAWPLPRAWAKRCRSSPARRS